MVFSLFKKPAEKMPERKAARPKPPPAPERPAGDLAPQLAEPAVPAAPVQEEPKKELPPLEFSDSQFDFTDSAVMAIEVDQDIDPVQAEIEQAAVLFANAQDSAARAVLETSARAHSGADAERLWRMLLDLVQVLGDRGAFEKLGEEFARVCETSPPTWRTISDKAPAPVAAGPRAIVLQGVINGGALPEFDQIRAMLQKKEAVRVDLGKLASCDEEAAAMLCELLRLARKQGVVFAIEGADGLVGRLETRLVMGQAESPNSWLLLLELLQQLGRQDPFEEKAVEYAVTFEVSPPSWEAVKAPPVAKASSPAPILVPTDDIHFLSGELKNCRFDDLRAFLDLHDRPVIDFGHVKRLDFFSAGLLRNIIEPFKRQGKEVLIRNPHHLVAELMGIVDLQSVARIIVPKY